MRVRITGYVKYHPQFDQEVKMLFCVFGCVFRVLLCHIRELINKGKEYLVILQIWSLSLNKREQSCTRAFNHS